MKSESEDDEDEGITDFGAFRTKTLTDAVSRAEAKGRAGGLRTQRGLVKQWKVRCWTAPVSLIFILKLLSRNGLSRL
jgi:hypothetical protein